MKKIYGYTTGLKTSQLKQLEKLYRRRISPEQIISPEVAREMSLLSHDIRRQIGLMINRKGQIAYVIAGDHHKILIPRVRNLRATPGRLMGLRCVHTHLKSETLTQDDLTDLVLLRLDLMAALTIKPDGFPDQLWAAHLLPRDTSETPYLKLPPGNPYTPDFPCLQTIQALETEMAHQQARHASRGMRERVLLVSVTTAPRRRARASLEELAQLAESAGLDVVDAVLQQRERVDPRFVLGIGKIKDLAITAMQKNIALLVFDQELNPSQIRSLTDRIELKVIDRTQLILDIFAQRARTREGKLQVELAQLNYLLPRLVTKNTAMSRLTGGIGGRGPGETKLEINRRRVRNRIAGLEHSLQGVRKQRKQQRARRSKRRLPIISIIGYTNAGKSTLLNALTRSKVHVEDRLFATLDPSSRRLKFPRDLEVIITDTVGFIRDLPKELMAAFRATLEELENADLLLHVIDISNPRHAGHIRAVERILADLGLERIKSIRVLNKQDRVDSDARARLARTIGGIPLSATRPHSLLPLIERMVSELTARPLNDNKLPPLPADID
ncbi:MAG: GTPase HflX [Desulfosarcina sp.]|nr:GTPase HflX [Desulfobacterales bacterium]